MIKKLPPDVISKIAAGEVIESPASVVRELVENSIDAGAKNIEISIKGAGLEAISVKDDGKGMTKADLEIATERYTTSKIRSIEDLSREFTLGFRGEALYSISQVSKLEIISGNGEEAWRVEYEGESVKVIEPFSVFKGTIVNVKDLFYNYPVRREFAEANIKRLRRELVDTVMNFVVAYPAIGFKVRWENKNVESYPAREIEIERFIRVFGEDFVREMKNFIVEEEDLKVYGFFKKPQYLSVKKKGLQYVFVNRRRVKLDFVRIAIKSAIGQENIIPEFIIFMELPPYLIDFNIHPQKKEVKVFNEKRLFSMIYHAVRKALVEERMVLSEIVKDDTHRVEKKGGAILTETRTNVLKEEARQLEFGEFVASEKEREEKKDVPYYVPERLFQIHNSYIVAEVESGIIIVDQHAAHERIIYEKLKKKKTGTKRLLFPVVLELDRTEMQVFSEYRALLESMGFEFRELGKNSVVIDGIPSVFDSIDKDIFKEIIGELKDDLNLPDKYQYTLKTIACKAAIKAGQKLTKEEMARLLDELFACDVPFFCPHGRPLIYKISLLELEKKFGRS